MKVDEYFSQDERYFSESSGEFVRLEEMPPQYALNAWRKLVGEYGDSFTGSPLSRALLLKVIPNRSVLERMFHQFGKAVIFVGEGGMRHQTARDRLKAAGATRTHLNGEWMEGHVEVPLVVKKV